MLVWLKIPCLIPRGFLLQLIVGIINSFIILHSQSSYEKTKKSIVSTLPELHRSTGLPLCWRWFLFMIDVKELRIGNYVYYPHMENGTLKGVGVVSSICETVEENELGSVTLRHEKIIALNLGNIEPLTLTKDWLNKLGFPNKQIPYIEDSHRYGELTNFNLKNGFWYADSGYFARCNKINYNPIKYVHQLQNLFFDLSGEELTIKP